MSERSSIERESCLLNLSRLTPEPRASATSVSDGVTLPSTSYDGP
jgi:hypothetical protein